MVYLMLFSMIVIMGEYRLCFALKSRNTYSHTIDDGERRYVVCISLMLIMLLFFKHDMMGNDTTAYRDLYESISAHGNIDYIYLNKYILGNGMEIAYLYMYLFFGSVYIPFRIMMFILAVFYVSAFGRMIYRYADIKWLSFMLFVLMGFLFFFTTNRQAIALAFSLYSFMNLQDGNKGRAIFYVCMACMFHISAIVCFLYYFFNKITWANQRVILLIVFLIPIFIYYKEIMVFLLQILGKGNYRNIAAGGIPIVVRSVLVVILGANFMKGLIRPNPIMQSMYSMMLLSLSVMPFCRWSPFFYRLSYYFTVYMMIFVPNVFHRAKHNRWMPTIVLLYMIAYGCYVFFGIGHEYQSTRNFPYYFCWEDFPADLIQNFGALTNLAPNW